MTLYVPKFKKERIDAIPPTEDITIRRFYRNIIEKPDFEMERNIYIGTVEGTITIQKKSIQERNKLSYSIKYLIY